VVPLVAAFGLIGEPTSQAAIGASGGVIEMSPIAAPEFVLTDQRGKRIAMRDFRGSLTLVAFLDPECDDSCPLIARQLVNAVQSLGSSASSVSILVVDINPVFNSVRDVAAFTDAHGLTDEPSWHFATGTNAEISNLLAAFGEGVSLPSVGMVGHPQSVYLFDRGGKALAVVNDTASEDLTQSYTDLIASTLRGQL
jgi:cytochrome oxidase Cu insertion factor (SCO1/SenC/PrrC family)